MISRVGPVNMLMGYARDSFSMVTPRTSSLSWTVSEAFAAGSVGVLTIVLYLVQALVRIAQGRYNGLE